MHQRIQLSHTPGRFRFKVFFFHFTNVFLLTGGNVNGLEWADLNPVEKLPKSFFHCLWKKVYRTLPFFISSGEMPASFPIKNRLLGSVK